MPALIRTRQANVSCIAGCAALRATSAYLIAYRLEALVITASGTVMLNAITAHAVAGCEIH